MESTIKVTKARRSLNDSNDGQRKQEPRRRRRRRPSACDASNGSFPLVLAFWMVVTLRCREESDQLSSYPYPSNSFVVFPVVDALDNGVALTPPMGWLSWERFGCNLDCEQYPDTCISERLYLTQAQRLVDDGYRAAGYSYIQIDDCWSLKERDPNTGNLLADPVRFPRGIRALADDIHVQGLLLGLYTDIGTKTCAGYPGLAGHFEQDANRFAEWAIDSIKVDTCNSDRTVHNITYPAFGRALNATGRPILYNCGWPLATSTHGETPDILNPYVKHVCNLWRNYYDIFDDWTSIREIVDHWSRPRTVMTAMLEAAGPGHWNDPDQLVVGNPGLSISEQQAQFALWCIFAAPLLASTDLRTISDASRAILLNDDAIAVNQDPWGRQGYCVEGCGGNLRVYVRELAGSAYVTGRTQQMDDHNRSVSSDRWAVVLANFNSIFAEQRMTFSPRQHLPTRVFRTIEHLIDLEDIWMNVRDVLKRKDIGMYCNHFTMMVDESSVQMFTVTLTHRQTPEDEKR